MKYFITLLFALSISTGLSFGQTFNFSLSGNPVNITGWTISNQSYVDNDEIVLTDNIGNQAGYIYFSTPQNLANCSQFTVTFDFKISNSSNPTADGLAFFYISNPPSGFTLGGGIGLPNNPNGLVAIMDTYDNNNTPDNPLVTLRRYDGNTAGYTEGSTAGVLGTNAINQNFIIDGNWHTCVISYSFGTVTVSYDNNPPIITGTTNLNINGYFGFSAATGALYARHAIKNVTIQGAAEPTPPVTDTAFYCQFETAQPLTAQGNNLLWYDTPVGGSSSATAPTPSTGTPGTFTWYVSTEVPGCNLESLRSPLVVVVHPQPQPPVIVVPIYCTGVTPVPLNVTFGQSIQWYDSLVGGTPSNTQPVINTSIPDTFIFYASQTAMNGCESERIPVEVVVHQTPVADFDYTVHYNCSGYDSIFFENNSQMASSYLWNFNSGSNSTEKNPIHVFPPGSYQVMLTASNHGCTASSLKTIEIGHTLKAEFLASNDTICEGDQVSFTNTSTVQTINGIPASYTWLLNETTIISNSQNASYTFNVPGEYKISLVARNSIPCLDTFTMTIVVDAIPEFGFNASDSIICKGDKIIFDLNNSETVLGEFYWNFGDSDEKHYNNYHVTHSYEETGNYTVKLNVNYRACPDLVSELEILVKDIPLINLGEDTTLCLNGQPLIYQDMINVSNPKAKWLWSTGDTTSGLSIRHEGIYSLAVSINGCTNKDEIVVTKDCYLNIPNSFTPNDDGENDYFMPRQLISKGVTQFSMTVRNRWGQIVFETHNINGRGWDGKFNGKEQTLGVYIYQIDAVFKNGREENYTGNVTLIR